jgi:hypothetical protein
LQASILEAYKDLPIAIVSFDCLFYLVSVKKAMLIGSAMVTLACVGMYFGNSFNMAKVCYRWCFICFDKSLRLPLIGTVTENQKNTIV